MTDFEAEDDLEEMPIASLSWDCDELFQECFTRLEHSSGHLKELLEDYAQRFTTWWEELGVFAGHDSDLELRLRRQPDIKDIVIQLLIILRRNLTYLISEFNSKERQQDMLFDTIKLARDGNMDSNSPAYLRFIFLKAIAESLKELSRIGDAIRQSSRTPEVIRAGIYAAKHLDIDSYETLSVISLQTMYPQAAEGLVTRLTESMVNRYAVIRFREFRQGVLSNDTRALRHRKPSNTQDTKDEPTKPPVRLDETSTLMKRPIEHPLVVQSNVAPTSLNEERLRENLEQRSFPVVQRGTTIALPRSKAPPRPLLYDKNGIELPCPWCSKKVGRELITKNKWTPVGIEHYRNDLKPFVCIAENCVEPDNCFSSTRAWSQHMKSHDPKWAQNIHQEPTWICEIPMEGQPLGLPNLIQPEEQPPHRAEFSSIQLLRHHTELMHADTTNRGAAQPLSSKPTRVGPRGLGTCPLCCLVLDTADMHPDSLLQESIISSLMVPHVIGHLQTIMVLSLRLIEAHEAADDDVQSVSVDDETTIMTETTDHSNLTKLTSPSRTTQAGSVYRENAAENAHQSLALTQEMLDASANSLSGVPQKDVESWIGSMTVLQDSRISALDGLSETQSETEERTQYVREYHSTFPMVLGESVMPHPTRHQSSHGHNTDKKSTKSDSTNQEEKASLSAPTQSMDLSLAQRPYSGSLGVPDLALTKMSPKLSIISDAGDQQWLRSTRNRTELLLRVQHQKPFSVRSWFGYSRHELPEALLSSYETNSNLSGSHQTFLPAGELVKLINPDSVARDLAANLEKSHSRDHITFLAEEVCTQTEIVHNGKTKIKSFRRLYALLTLSGVAFCIESFLEADFSDLQLPLVWPTTGGSEGLYVRDSLGQSLILGGSDSTMWTPARLRKFYDNQWKLLAPFFSQDNHESANHYLLRDDHILPLIGTTKTVRQDGFRKTFRVQIHSDHHRFRNNELSTRGFEIQQQTYESDASSFANEVQILRKFSGEGAHRHIVSLLATFEQSRRIHLLFHHAENDLLSVWMHKNFSPLLNYTNITWLAEQCAGLSDGLRRLHRYTTSVEHRPRTEAVVDHDELPSTSERRVTSQRLRAMAESDMVKTIGLEITRDTSSISKLENRPTGEENYPTTQLRTGGSNFAEIQLFTRHGDIKPENIHWVHDGTSSSEAMGGDLKLAGFGLATLASADVSSSSATLSPTYRPPECDLHQPVIKQANDIWCLGCTYLEFLTWFLMGAGSVQEFSKYRLSLDGRLGVQSDTFFEALNVPRPNQLEFKVKESVTRFIRKLHEHPNCTQYIHGFLNLIEFSMLVIDPSERYSSNMIALQLEWMLSDCCVDETYATKRAPWVNGRPSIADDTPEAEEPVEPGKPEDTLQVTSSGESSKPRRDAQKRRRRDRIQTLFNRQKRSDKK
ncbi:hypothetical protein OPT61_g1615 [Boeremia exigua]|uniref:Uncharacterized protein n=1 Tax=Boeremia exigua TaxID=749465 RepID=A0ACC2IPJ0_9PLEO|nr:hypothetical protein OPT61_g1615 [Boeremia exigua]